MNGKLIVIEGTDCSGKETQSRLLVEKLNQENIKAKRISFPMYDTPTGQIIGACLLGKPEMCNEFLKMDHSFFKEGGGNVESLAASAFYAADRRYNLPIINKYLDEGYILVVDRYVPSNMSNRCGMIEDKDERIAFYKKIELLEYGIMELPKPDMILLLYVPYQYACELKKNRKELPDEAESDINYLKRGEEAYLELAELYNYEVINCVSDNKIRTEENINEEVYKKVKKLVK